MNCLRFLKGNIVHPDLDPRSPISRNEKVTADDLDRFSRETHYCGFCKHRFNYGENELKVHCNICNHFFHCGIAGECIGKDCSLITPEGNIHRARYCINCVSKIFKNNTCLCKDCDSR